MIYSRTRIYFFSKEDDQNVFFKVSKNRCYVLNLRKDVKVIRCVMQRGDQQDGLYWSDIQTIDPARNVLLRSDVQQF